MSDYKAFDGAPRVERAAYNEAKWRSMNARRAVDAFVDVCASFNGNLRAVSSVEIADTLAVLKRIQRVAETLEVIAHDTFHDAVIALRVAQSVDTGDM